MKITFDFKPIHKHGRQVQVFRLAEMQVGNAVATVGQRYSIDTVEAGAAG